MGHQLAGTSKTGSRERGDHQGCVLNSKDETTGTDAVTCSAKTKRATRKAHPTQVPKARERRQDQPILQPPSQGRQGTRRSG